MLEQPISLSTDKAVFEDLTDSTDRDNLHLVSELLLDHDVPFVVLRDDYTRNTCLSGRLNLVRHADDGQHDTRIISHHSETIDATNLCAGVPEHLVVSTALEILISELLLDRSCHFLRIDNVCSSRVLSAFGTSDISCDSNKPAEVSKH